MLERLFIEVLNMSLTGSVVILAVLLSRLLLHKFPKIFSYLLWIIVLFRLLCPVSFSASPSLLGALQNASTGHGKMEYIPSDIGYQAEPFVSLPFSPLNDTVNDSLPAGNPAYSVNPLQIYLYLGGRIWLLGIMVLLGYGTISLFRLNKRLKTALPKTEFPGKRIYQTDCISTPFVYGVIRPAIYLPARLGKDEETYILLHEQIHIRRGDHIFRLLAYGALCIHWFNPLVWAAFFLSGQDMEMSCDESVIRQKGNQVKREYSQSLLSLAVGSRMVRGTPIAFGEGNTKERIKNVLRYKKPSAFLAGTAVVICILLAVILLANPATKNSVGNEEQPFLLINPGAERLHVFYGIVGYGDIGEGIPPLVVKIPRLGDVIVPNAKEVYPYIEIDFDGLEAGDLVQIIFPDNEDVSIMETYPAQFSQTADSIAVMGRGSFSMELLAPDCYAFTVPLGMASGARPGDTLEIYHHAPEIDGQETQLLTSVLVKDVVESEYQIWVELSTEELETFLSEFGFGISCSLVKAGD